MDNKFALIIEDNPMLSNIFARALRDINYETEIIPDGKLALDRLLIHAPDLLLLDMHLPNVSGREILEAIYEDQRFENTYIVIVTADARMGEMLVDKANFLLNKPVDIIQFQQLAERLKNNHQKTPQQSRMKNSKTEN